MQLFVHMLTVPSCSASSVGTVPTEEAEKLVSMICTNPVGTDEAEPLGTVSMICTNICVDSDTKTPDDERCTRSKHVRVQILE